MSSPTGEHRRDRRVTRARLTRRLSLPGEPAGRVRPMRPDPPGDPAWSRLDRPPGPPAASSGRSMVQRPARPGPRGGRHPGPVRPDRSGRGAGQFSRPVLSSLPAGRAERSRGDRHGSRMFVTSHFWSRYVPFLVRNSPSRPAPRACDLSSRDEAPIFIAHDERSSRRVLPDISSGGRLKWGLGPTLDEGLRGRGPRPWAVDRASTVP